MKRILLLIIVVSLPLMASADVVEINGICYNLNTQENTAEVVSNSTKYSGAISIPETVTHESVNYFVTSIGANAFNGCTGLTSISIGNNVVRIGAYAFRNCSNLTSITIPESVITIGNESFFRCSNLTTVTIGNNVTSIGGYAFYDCSNMTSMNIGNSVTNIGEKAFSGCSGLTSITIPESVVSIGISAFYECTGLKKIIVPDIAAWCKISFRGQYDNPLYYAHHIFSDEETEITRLIIPEGVTTISACAFIACSGLTSIKFPSSVINIRNSAFSGCTGLKKVIVPDIAAWCNILFGSLTGYSSNSNPLSFVHHIYSDEETEIKKLIIPEGVADIASYAFSGCEGVESVTIPESVKSIGDYAFSSCSNLNKVTCYAENVPTINNSIFNDSPITSATLYVPACSINLYRISSPWSGFGTIIPIGGTPSNIIFEDPNVKALCIANWDINKDGELSEDEAARVTNLGEVFKGNTSIASFDELQYFTSLTDIDNYSFEKCTGLTSVIIPYGVASIGSCAFKGCSSLTSVTIPNSVTSIVGYAFAGCISLTSIDIPESVTSISYSVFDGCSSLASVTIPNGVTNIGSYTFSGCCSLTTITIPNNVTNIDYGAFYGCRSLTCITIPKDVTSIGSSAFSGCTNLTSVTLESNTIVSESRSTSTSMKSIFGNQVKAYILGNPITSIGNHAFYGCGSLISVTIPNSVINISPSAFSDCKNLTTVILNNNSIVSASRTYSTSMKSIFDNQVKKYMIGDCVTSIGHYAFYNCSNLSSIYITDNVTSIGNNAFYGCDDAKIYVNRGTDVMFLVWNYGLDPYETGTSQILARPSISVLSTTQTTITYCIDNYYPELEYNCTCDENVGENEYLIKGLRPDYQQTICLSASSANNSYNTSTSATTSPISPTVISKNVTASSITIAGNHIEGDAKIVSKSLIINGEETCDAERRLYGLEPNRSYTFKCIVVVEDDNGSTYSYEGSSSIRTASLILTTQQPKVISVGNVVVAANSNLDDGETNVGFEWRRTDWTDDFVSNTGVAYLYNGAMEGYIRNLNTEKLWKYRPYYEAKSGNRYYGSWVGIDPTNTCYFEPTVHTYTKITMNGNRAEVKGYVMRGTDNVTRQGFMYWKREYSAKSVPANANVLEAKGNVMIATLENLDYDTEYYFVAFVTTSENKTFYGEVQIFKTDAPSQEVIDGIELNEKLRMKNVESAGAVYDLNGHKLSVPQRGLNIIRMSDGTSRKVLVR